MPTAAAAGIGFACDLWPDVTPGQGELRFLVTPRSLAEP